MWPSPVLLAAAAPIVSVCYAARGVGVDLSAPGHGIEHADDRNKRY